MAKFLDNNGLLYLWSKIKSAFVAKEAGKGLSTNDYSTEEKTKLSGIEAEANKTTVQNILTSDSTTDALSAAMGKSLKSSIDAISTDIGNLGGGDMMKATYDADGDGVVDDAENAQKLNGQSPSYYAKATDIPTIDSTLSSTSANPIQNKAVNAALANKANVSTSLSGYGISDAYTKTEVDRAITTATANAGHLKRLIVESLPAIADADPDTIYMVLEDADSDNNKYVEYMLINGAFERTGSSDVDLSGYLQKTEVTEITNSDIDTIVAS